MFGQAIPAQSPLTVPPFSCDIFIAQQQLKPGRTASWPVKFSGEPL